MDLEKVTAFRFSFPIGIRTSYEQGAMQVTNIENDTGPVNTKPKSGFFTLFRISSSFFGHLARQIHQK